MADTVKPPVRSLDGELWRGVVGHEEFYSISSKGRLFSHHSKRLLKPARGRRVVLSGGRAISVPDLVLEAFGQPRPQHGLIAWPTALDIRWPYSVDNLEWITRPRMLQILSRARTAKLAAERARWPRPRPQPEVICYRDIPATPSPRTSPKGPAQRRPRGAGTVVEYYEAGSPAGTSLRA